MKRVLLSAAILLALGRFLVGKSTPPGYIISLGQLTAEYRDNAYNPAKINGIESLFSNWFPLVDAYDVSGNGAGLDWEHTLIWSEDPRNMFAPRSGAFPLTVIDAATVRLTRLPANDPWRVGATMTYHMVAPNTIDLDVRLTPQDARLFGGSYVIFMFADYMSPVADVALHFRGVTGLGAPETWIAGDAPPMGSQDYSQGAGGTYRHENASALPIIGANVSALNIVSYDWPRFTTPCYYGLSRNGMTYELFFDRSWSVEDEIRFSLFKFKLKNDPANPKPAWDWQYVVHAPVSGKEYGFRTRMRWEPFVSRADSLTKCESWRASL